MKIFCIGAGPAGLYFAISMKLKNPTHEITVVERNSLNDTFGWGVVLSDGIMEKLKKNDIDTALKIEENFAHWDDISIVFKDNKITTSGHGFSGIGRLKMLQILQERALDLGVDIKFGKEFEPEDVRALEDFDLIVASDGVNSKIRNFFSDGFEPTIDRRPNKFIWLGTYQKFNDAFTFLFKETACGWVCAHCYQFDSHTSTFLIECSEETWRRLGFENINALETIAICEGLFEEHLGGHSLLINGRHDRGSAWINFPLIKCRNWFYENVVLLGDAAHTAHFSIGSGTRLALEDSICLSEALNSEQQLDVALGKYQQSRRNQVNRLQEAAYSSMVWFESIHLRTDLDPTQFFYSLLTRSQVVHHESLRLRDRNWLESIEDWFAVRNLGYSPHEKTPPIFLPFKVRGLALKNRVVMHPLASELSYEINSSYADMLLIKFGSNAMGGASLIMSDEIDVFHENCGVEAVSDESLAALKRFSKPGQEYIWKRIVKFIHTNSDSKICARLGYDDEGNFFPSTANQGMDLFEKIISCYVSYARVAASCEFDMLELKIDWIFMDSLNFRSDLNNDLVRSYGDSINRIQLFLDIVKNIRRLWPDDKPISVRVVSSKFGDYINDNFQEAIEFFHKFKSAGVDFVNIPVDGTAAMLFEKISREVKIACIVSGNIFKAGHANSLILSGKADLCSIAPKVENPYWVKHMEAELESQ